MGIGLIVTATAAPAGAHPPQPRGPAFEVVASPALPAGATLNAITTGPGAHAWAVGQAPTSAAPDAPTTGIIEHWDGHHWRLEPLPELSVGGTALTSVSVGRDGSVFAAGIWYEAGQSNHPRPLTLRRDRTGWVELPFTDNSLSYYYRVRAVSAYDANNVWTAGVNGYKWSYPFIGRWDGTTWTTASRPPLLSHWDGARGVVAIAPDDVWVCGYTTVSSQRLATAFHFDGAAWTQATLPTANDAPAGWSLEDTNGIAATASDDVWLWGGNALARFDGTAWHAGPFLPASTPTLAVDVVAPLGRDRALVAGVRPAASTNDHPTGTVLAWSHNRWSNLSLPESLTAATTTTISLAAGRGSRATWAIVTTTDPTTGPTTTILRLTRR